ncbi:unnamed protein product [Rotaria socialis]|uniref:Guanylate cyclase domain-containing protein n=3 Tax=Rotaria socialis TaxID=392032 RepID=A0A817Y131_9BILA|nr:unnamed protein product [Rotaria socialis]CAF4740481.1 unnamed protein product [Rotaria socialis]
MDNSKSYLTYQPTEIIHPKTKALIKKTRRKQTLRRIGARCLPSLATNTVKMVVATLQIGSTTNEEILDDNDDDDDDDVDNDDDETFPIGQQVQAHIPDIVLNNLNDLIDQKGNILIPSEHKYNKITLLFLDVSGFTSLTEQYSNDAHLGIDQLTHTLNSYFDTLVSQILLYNGDIYKFAGDAILAVWANEFNGTEQALKCALYLQEKCGSYETDVGVVLRLKIAIAYGPVRALFIGTDEFKHYILAGDCVKDVNICEQLCEPGDIIITNAVYEHVRSLKLNCEYLSINDDINREQAHIAVKYCGAVDDNHELTKISDKLNISNQEISKQDKIENHRTSSPVSDTIDEELYNKIDSLMKSFLLRCVYQHIERQQSLEYLSELRRVTITFINLDISNERCTNNNLCQNVQKVFIQIYELTKMMGGVLTKALLFDKGWSFLCVFGLPGYKQGDDTANALKCAQMIHSTMHKQCKFIDKCSIGVATGLTYCGVVGHVARCEYTVIGRKVNMAARLMCNYPNIISCDQETYYNSHLNSRCFQILPDKILKGMNNVGIIWQYGDYLDNAQIKNSQTIQQNKSLDDDIRNENYPLLGRRIELMIVATQIMSLEEPLNRRRDLAAIIFEGDDKIGRSRLLQFITDSFENSNNSNNSMPVSCYENNYISHDSTIPNVIPVTTNDNQTNRSSASYPCANDYSTTKKLIIRVIKYSCQLEQRFNEFCLLRSLLRQLLQFHNDDKTQHEREQYLLKLFDLNKSNDLYLRRNLFLLNDLLDVRFRRSPIETENNNEKNFVRTYETNINELLLHILNQLIEPSANTNDTYTNTVNGLHSSYSQLRLSTGSVSTAVTYHIPTASKILFIIDDIHFADESSLKHLLTLGSHSKCLLILSMKPPHNNHNSRSTSNTLQSISTDSRVYLRRLPGLELRYLATLACQILSVHKVPTKIVKVLNESCNGIPGFCEQILFDLLSKDKIYITNNTDAEDEESNLIEGDADKLIVNSSMQNSLSKSLFSRRKQIVTDEQYQLEPIFSRVCLLRDPTANDFIAHCQQNFQNYIMCRIDRLSEGESLLVKIAAVIGNTFSRTFLWQLVDPQSKKLININECILDMMQRSVIECAYQQQQSRKTHTIKCFCLQNPAGFPSQCRLMAFTHVSIRDGIYNSLTDSLKRTIIRNAIDYLEKQCRIICLTCGSRNDIPFFVQKQDGLTRTIKTSNQHAFVDIVKMVALREIDHAIKQSIKLRSLNAPGKPRSNTSANMEAGSSTTLAGYLNINDNKSSNKTQEKRRNSYDVSGFGFQHGRRSQSPFLMLAEDDIETKMNHSIHHTLEDSNSTLVSFYPFKNNQSESIPTSMEIDIQRSSSLTSAPSSHIFTIFKLSKQRRMHTSLSKVSLLKTMNGSIMTNKSNENEAIVQQTHKMKSKKIHRFRSFFRCIFCQVTPAQSKSSVAAIDFKRQSAKSLNDAPMPDIEKPATLNSLSQKNESSQQHASHWRKVRQALIPSPNRVLQGCPTDKELLEKPMFSSESMAHVLQDLACLNQQIYRIQTFQNLYDQSLLFHVFQSYVQYKNLIEYVYETKHKEQDEPNLNKYANEFTNYNDLRICQCADYVLTIYAKLVEYHTNLYNMYEKLVDDKRDYLRRKQFDQINYYRIEICQLLLSLNSLQRLLVEIENGRKFFDQFQNEIINKDDYFYQYQYILTKYTYNLLEASVLQRTRSIFDAKLLCDQSLKELKNIDQDQLWENLKSNTDLLDCSSAKERRAQYEHTKDFCTNTSSNSQTSQSDQLYIFVEKYRLEYLICQYHLLQYQLSRDQSIESVNALIDLEYYTYPISFSLPCTVILIEYFYCQMDFNQCLTLIDRMITFWWLQTTPREKLELGKLKSLSLIIELKQGSFESAILSGYFAKRLLTGYHENIFLIETCIHLTLALIGEMRISNIELILQHLEYLSEQTMNCYAKLWYYILVIDVAIELGYELMPITIDFLENITKYRKKLLTGPNQRSLLIVYSDCVLAQIYIRLGLLNMSKIHFQQALHQIKYDQMHLSNIDFCFKRALLKLIETQLLYWYHTKEDEETIAKDYFLLHAIEHHVNDKLIPWNRSRYFIYQAYYDRLINDYKRTKGYSIDNDFDWKLSLEKAEINAVKLDLEWIKQLRQAWLRSMSQQLSFQINQSLSIGQPRTSTLMNNNKSTNRPFIRPPVPHIKISSRTDKHPDEQSTITVHNYSHQKFVDWRLFLTHNILPKFQFYILPVRV